MANDFLGSASPWPEPDFSDPWGKAPKLPAPWDRVTSAAEWDDVPIPLDVPDKANPFIVDVPDPTLDIHIDGKHVTMPNAPVRDARNQARLRLNAELADWYESSIIGMGPFHTVDLYCGRCMITQGKRRRPSKKTIGVLACYGSTWEVGMEGEPENVDSEYAPFVRCPQCWFEAQITSRHNDLTEFFLLHKERRRRQSLDHLVKIGLAKEYAPPF